MPEFALRGGKRAGRISWCSGCTKEAREQRVEIATAEERAAVTADCLLLRTWRGPTEAGPLRPSM